MNRSKRIMIAAGALFIMLAFVIVGVYSLREYEMKMSEQASAAVSVPRVEPKETLPMRRYVLKIEDGILVVFNENDMTRPIIVTDVYASTLRHTDRKELTEGVVAAGDFELQTLLEDYSS